MLFEYNQQLLQHEDLADFAALCVFFLSFLGFSGIDRLFEIMRRKTLETSLAHCRLGSQAFYSGGKLAVETKAQPEGTRGLYPCAVS